MPVAAVEEEARPLDIDDENVSKGAALIGVVHSFLGATEAQEKILELSGAAEHYILAYLFTFDREDIMAAWANAVRRGVEVEPGVDRNWTLSGQCRDQYRLVTSLAAAGVKVRLLTGVDKKGAYAAVGRTVGGVGNQHAKCVHTDKGTVVGSTNLTTSSRANNEVSVHVSLQESAARGWRYEMAAYISTGEPREAAEKRHNIRRYYGDRRARSLAARQRVALSDFVPEGHASD